MKNFNFLSNAILFLLAACSPKSNTDIQIPTSENKITSEVVGDLKISEIKILEGNKPLECRNFRLRRLDVIPGGVVGIHSHENRPAVLSIAKGEGAKIHAYRHEPVEIKFGEAYKEFNSIVHYAYNLSKSDTLSIITSDLLDDGSTCNNHTFPQHTPLLDDMRTTKDLFFQNAPKSVEDESNIPIYSTSIQDINFPQGKALLEERHLRVRRITLKSGATTGVQDLTNRPTYLMGVKGAIEVKNVNSTSSETINPLGTANLVNVGEVEVKNNSGEEAVYFVMELWDPTDTDI